MSLEHLGLTGELVGHEPVTPHVETRMAGNGSDGTRTRDLRRDRPAF